MINNILNNFPIEIRNLIRKELENNNCVEEIRIRINLPIILKIGNMQKIINHTVTREEIDEIMQHICENSLYSYQNQIADGYITINGGHRVGIVGSAVVKDDKVINLNYISGLNFRISRQVIDCSNCIIEELLDRQNDNIYTTLIVSPPGMGKTTILRDIVRKISNGMENFNGINVTVIDERGEIGACYKGICQNDLGIRTDILNDMPKSIGMKMAIRSMSPKVIIADEIGKKEDSDSIKYAVCSGVKGIFTAHGANINDLMTNPAIKDLLESKIFERIIVIKNRNESKITRDIFTKENNYNYNTK